MPDHETPLRPTVPPPSVGSDVDALAYAQAVLEETAVALARIRDSDPVAITDWIRHVTFAAGVMSGLRAGAGDATLEATTVPGSPDEIGERVADEAIHALVAIHAATSTIHTPRSHVTLIQSIRDTAGNTLRRLGIPLGGGA